MTSIDKLIGDGNIFYVVSCMLSVESYKQKYTFWPEAAHDSEDDLLFWAENGHNFEVREVPGFSLSNAKWIVDPQNYYEAVWVRAGFKLYRDVLSWHAKTYGATDDSIKPLDADHVINQATIVKSKGEDAWIMLFPVTASSNRSFGAAIEKKLPIVSASGSLDFEALQLMKTHVFEKMKNKQEVDFALNTMSSLIMLENQAEKDALLKKAGDVYSKLRGWS